MTLRNRLQPITANFPFSVTGILNFSDSDGKVVIKLDDDAELTVSESDINPDLIFPLSELEFPQGIGHIVKLQKNASVTLRYKTVSHTFKLNFETERQFYIDMEQLQVRYIDELPKDTDPTLLQGNCKKWVLVVDLKCCRNNRYIGRGYGFVSCGQTWNDSRCCP